MESRCKYKLHIWQEDAGDSLPEDHGMIQNDQNLYINMRICFVLLDLNQPKPLTFLVKTFHQKLFHNSSYLPSGDRVSESCQRKTIRRIVRFVKPFLSQEGSNISSNSNQNLLMIGVGFGVMSDDEYTCNYIVPASKASVDALERVKVEDNGDSVDQLRCAICLEELEMGGKEVNCMPYKHVFHGDCIAQWLEKSHSCPLCRFPMPVDGHPTRLESSRSIVIDLCLMFFYLAFSCF
eukprot:XP_025013311.1 probable E3 ubiquitin-protein ligase RHC2A [Ricinus communis]